MKKQKLAVIFAALLTMAGFSSCLNSEDDGISEYYGYLEVNSGWGNVTFSTPDGLQFVPNKTVTTTASSKLAFVYCQYNDVDLTAETKKLPVTLLRDPVYLKDLGYAESTLPDVTSTVSLYSLGENGGGIWGYNKYLVLTPAYFLKKGTTDENLSTELVNHNLKVYYVPAEDNVTTKTLKLYLRYQLTGIDDSSTEEGAETSEAWANDYTVKYSDPVYVSLSSLLAQYENAHGEKPEKLEVDYEYNNNSYTVPTKDTNKKRTKTVVYNLYKETAAN
ncbi:hypothetical protein [Phocaeicola plebeius]|uniref:hypothetical protein n=1 Tax=Phocaeicola plebeius TaxID=310297 RepID=UPI0026DA7791|nr:hypothetical protein [Phocaeicola plebeius]